jgi:hypothetical protein
MAKDHQWIIKSSVRKEEKIEMLAFLKQGKCMKRFSINLDNKLSRMREIAKKFMHDEKEATTIIKKSEGSKQVRKAKAANRAGKHKDSAIMI